MINPKLESKPLHTECADPKMKIFFLELEISGLKNDIENKDYEIEQMRRKLEVTGRLFEERGLPPIGLSYYYRKDDRSKKCLQIVG